MLSFFLRGLLEVFRGRLRGGRLSRELSVPVALAPPFSAGIFASKLVFQKGKMLSFFLQGLSEVFRGRLRGETLSKGPPVLVARTLPFPAGNVGPKFAF